MITQLTFLRDIVRIETGLLHLLSGRLLILHGTVVLEPILACDPTIAH